MWLDPHIQEAFVYERITDALREAAQRRVLREIQARRAWRPRDGLQRFLHSTFCLQLKRRIERMSLR